MLALVPGDGRLFVGCVSEPPSSLVVMGMADDVADASDPCRDDEFVVPIVCREAKLSDDECGAFNCMVEVIDRVEASEEECAGRWPMTLVLPSYT